MPYKVLTVHDEGDDDRLLDQRLQERLDQAERGGWELRSLEQLPPRGQRARLLMVFRRGTD